ncbi:MAG: hypothetical protein AAF798_02635 [Bacteroidota bacterium]
MDIQYLKRDDIDKVKWNSCVHYANNGNIFGYMWYLDHVAKEWDALVEGDYESVWPLVWRKNMWNGKELYQPNLMRELGIYSINVLSPKRIRHFLEALPDEFRSIDIVLNEQNQLPKETGFQVSEQQNFQLWMDRSYEDISAYYTPALLEALDVARGSDLIPLSSLKPERIADFYLKYSKDRNGKDRNFHTLQRIMYNVLHRGWGFASGIVDREETLYAANFFIFSHGKLLSLVPTVSPAGEQLGALEMLTDLIVRTNAGRPLLLDFNTNGDSSLAEAFGAVSTPYFSIQRKQRKWGLIWG